MSSNTTTTPTARAFIGTWALESFTEHSEAAGLVHPLGESPSGILIYTEEGFVSAQLMKSGRKEMSGDLWDIARSVGLAELAAGYIAYCGRFTVNAEAQQVVHTPIVALIPNLVDHSQLRTYSFEGRRLSLENRRAGPDKLPVTARLVWRRHSSFSGFGGDGTD